MVARRIVVGVVSAMLMLAALSMAGTFIYPPGKPLVVDVTQPPWNVDNTGTQDVTTNLQAVINAYKAETTSDYARIIYLPAGTYVVSKQLVGSTNDNGQGKGWIIIQGASRTGTVIRLRDNCDGTGGTDDFSNPAQPRAVLDYFVGNWSNNAFVNVLENLTIDVGSGNAGAIGVHFYDNNCGCVREVTIRASGANPVGAVGLSTALRGPNGMGLIKDVYVEGFKVGLAFDNENYGVMGWALEDVTVVNQSECGVSVARKPVAIRRLVSTNSVPAVRVRHEGSLVSILDSVCVGGAATSSAVEVESGYVFVRNIVAEGYGATVYDAKKGGLIAGDFRTGEYRTAAGAWLWDATPQQSLNLPVEDTPEVAWDAPEDWAVVDVWAQDDDTEAVRAAMESGKTTVAFTPGVCKLSDTVRIGRKVRRVLGQWVRLQATGGLKLGYPARPVFRFEESDHAAVVFEKFDAMWIGNNINVYLMHHASASDLVMRDIFWVEGTAYRNDPVAGGRVFVENMHTLRGSQTPFTNDPAWVVVNQEMYARQLNPEMLMPHVVNNGGRVWVLGGKFGEQIGPVVETKKHGETELFSVLQNTTYDPDPGSREGFSLLEANNGLVSAVMFERTTWGDGGNGWGFHSNVVRETRGSEQRRIVHTAEGSGPWSNHWFSHPGVTNRADEHGAFIGFYAGYPARDGGNVAPSVPVISGAAAVTFTNGVVLNAASSDGDGPLPLVIRWAKVSGPGAASFSAATESNTTVMFGRPGRYVVQATASDGATGVTARASVESVFESEWRAPLRAAGCIQDTNGNGQGDVVLATPLRAGETTGTPEVEHRAQCDFDLFAMVGMTDLIGSVRLRLTPSAVNAPADMDVMLVASYGVIETGDFGRGGVLAASTGSTVFMVNQAVEFDVTEAVLGALAEGRSSLGLRLQRASDLSGAPHYVDFYDSSYATYGPRLLVTPKAPPAPVNLHTTMVTETVIGLAWEQREGTARAYELQRRGGATGMWETIAVVGVGQRAYTDSGSLAGGVTYYYRVAATNVVGKSEYSNEVQAELIPEPAGVVAGLVGAGMVGWWRGQSAETRVRKSEVAEE